MGKFTGRNSALKIPLIYLCITGLYIFLSDKVLSLFIADLGEFQTIESLKGSIFIIITAVILYWLIKCENGKRKSAEDALIESEAKYRSLVEGSLVGVYLYQNGRFQYVNPRYAQIFGYTHQELLEMDIIDLCIPEDKVEALKIINNLLNGEIGSIHHQARGLTKNNHIVDFEAIRTLTVYNGKPAIIGTLLDITERKRTEELLQNADKLSAVGELAAGIAHEIRNPLTSIRGFVQLAKSEDTENKKKLRHEVMMSEIDRINEIVSELLVLAKPSNEAYGLGNIVDKLNDVVTLLEGQANLYNVLIIKEFDSNIPAIRSHNNIKQVFINVLKNAIESMPKGGEVRIHAKCMDEKVCVQIIDRGCGIQQDQLAKIGDPFFTTKETGTGLGLMVSRKIVQNHEGIMRIESEVGRGTTVEVILPIAR